jgi:hypothetical protein
VTVTWFKLKIYITEVGMLAITQKMQFTKNGNAFV